MVCSAQSCRSTKSSVKGDRPRRRRGTSGYSLVEILVVVGIMAMLIALVGPSAMRMFEGSKTKTDKIQTEQLRAALDIFLLDVGRYPTDAEGLTVLVKNASNLPSWNGPYLRDGQVPLDPWGQPYRYVIADGVVRVVSSQDSAGQPGGNFDAGSSN
jgi:general secretion pathway protein G